MLGNQDKMAGKSKVCTGIQSQLILPNWIYFLFANFLKLMNLKKLCTKCGENSGPLSLFRIFDFFHTMWESPGAYPMSMLLISCGKTVGPSSTRVNLKFTPYNLTNHKTNLLITRKNYKRYFHLWFTILFLPVWWHMNNMSYLAWLRVFRFLLLLVCIQRLMLLGQFSRNW